MENEERDKLFDELIELENIIEELVEKRENLYMRLCKSER